MNLSKDILWKFHCFLLKKMELIQKRKKNFQEIIKSIYNGFKKYHNEEVTEYSYVYEEEIEFIKNNIIKKRPLAFFN